MSEGPASISATGQQDREAQRNVGEEQQAAAVEHPAGNQRTGEKGTECRARRGANGDQRQEARAAVAGVEVGGHGPELRHHEDAKHAHPQVEHDPSVGQVRQ